MVITKVCTSCKSEKPINLFSKRSSSKSGYSSSCKECCSNYHKKYRKDPKNKDKLAAIRKTFEDKHPNYRKNISDDDLKIRNQRRREHYALNKKAIQKLAREQRRLKKELGLTVKRKITPEYREWLRTYLKGYSKEYSKKNKDYKLILIF
mgnify:CR=1 FL=1